MTRKEMLKRAYENNEEYLRKAKERIERAEQKRKRLSEEITSLENSEYGTVVRAYNMTPEQLAEFLAKAGQSGNIFKTAERMNISE